MWDCQAVGARVNEDRVRPGIGGLIKTHALSSSFTPSFYELWALVTCLRFHPWKEVRPALKPTSA